MNLNPLNEEAMKKTAQCALVYLDSPNNSTPNSMIEGMASAKAIFRGMIEGTLVVCELVAPEKVSGPSRPPKEVEYGDSPQE